MLMVRVLATLMPSGTGRLPVLLDHQCPRLSALANLVLSYAIWASCMTSPASTFPPATASGTASNDTTFSLNRPISRAGWLKSVCQELRLLHFAVELGTSYFPFSL